MLRTIYFAMSVNEFRNSLPLKNACLTVGQFGECTTAHQIAPNTTTVLTTAIATPFAPSCRNASPNRRELRLSSGPTAGPGAPRGTARATPPPARVVRHNKTTATLRRLQGA